MLIKLPHIGRLIEEKIREVGMTKAEFGRRINTSRQNVNTILRKEHLPADILAKASRILGYNFFEEYVSKSFLSERGLLDSFPIESVKLKGLGLVIELSEPEDFIAFMEWWVNHKGL